MSAQILTDRNPEQIHDTYSFLIGCAVIWGVHAVTRAFQIVHEALNQQNLGLWGAYCELLVKGGLLNRREDIGTLVSLISLQKLFKLSRLKI